MIYFNFLNFVAFVLEFSITRQVGTKRNDNFYFLYLSLFQPVFPWNATTIVFFNFWIFLLFFWNFLLRIKLERNGTIIFIFSLSRPFPTYFGLKWSHNGIFWFFNFFFSFFGIFYYPSSWNGTERQFLFSLFLGLFKPILAWREAITGFFNFLNFFAIFFWIISYPSDRDETKR